MAKMGTNVYRQKKNTRLYHQWDWWLFNHGKEGSDQNFLGQWCLDVQYPKAWSYIHSAGGYSSQQPFLRIFCWLEGVQGGTCLNPRLFGSSKTTGSLPGKELWTPSSLDTSSEASHCTSFRLLLCLCQIIHSHWSHWSHTVVCVLKLGVIIHFSVLQIDVVPCTSMGHTYFLDKEFVPSVLKGTQVSCRCDTRRTAGITDFSPSSLLDAFTVKHKWFLNSMLSTSRKPGDGARAQGGTRKKKAYNDLL